MKIVLGHGHPSLARFGSLYSAYILECRIVGHNSSDTAVKEPVGNQSQFRCDTVAR